MLDTNTEAPNFTLKDQTGQIHSLADYRGKWVLLYFYPKDDTPGCTKEACMLRDHSETYTKNDIVILGVSNDSELSHQKFITKYNLPFTLLSDPEKTVITQYGAHGMLSTKRISYLIDTHGKIAKVYGKVVPEQHAQEVLADIEAFNSNQ